MILALQDQSVPRATRARLGREARFVSQVCAIEMAIKHSIGKLALPAPFQSSFGYGFDAAISEMSADLLTVEMRHIEVLSHLPVHHRDPFDRLIISQALAEGLTVVTRDGAFRAYDGLDVLDI